MKNAKSAEFRTLDLVITLSSGSTVEVRGFLQPETRGYTLGIQPPTLPTDEALQVLAALEGLLAGVRLQWLGTEPLHPFNRGFAVPLGPKKTSS